MRSQPSVERVALGSRLRVMAFTTMGLELRTCDNSPCSHSP